MNMFSAEALEQRRLFAAMSQVESNVAFVIQDLVADTKRELVYALDGSNDAVLAIDARLGRTVARYVLDGDAFAIGAALQGDRLFVTQPQQKQIEVLSLPELRPVATLPLTEAAYDVVHGARDRLYVTRAPNQWSWIARWRRWPRPIGGIE